MIEYQSILSAASGLLGETVSLLEGEEPFVVVGGWSPYLLNTGPIRHPGTRDVDLLFKNAARPETLEEIVRKLCLHGFRRSAKHEFQLLRVLSVRDTEFVFNVDLLHPSDPKSKTAEFVDQMSLPIPLSEFRDDLYTVMSIGVPGAEFLFEGYTVFHDAVFVLPNGTEAQVRVPLMSELGTIVTKSGTCLHPKRLRDAFDVYLAVVQARDRDALLNDCRTLQKRFPEQFNSLFSFMEIIADAGKSSAFADRVNNVLADLGNPMPQPTWDDPQRSVQPIIDPIASLLKDIPLPAKASRRYQGE